MEMEITDICMDKVCSNGFLNDLTHTIPNHQDVADSKEHTNGYTQPQTFQERIEVHKYEVKEGTAENSVTIPGFCHVDDCEDQDIESSNFHAAFEEKVRLEASKEKDNNKTRVSLEDTSKSANGNLRTKITVPQPFALATERRASSITGMGKPSKMGKVQNPVKIIKTVSPPISRKPLQPDNKNHSDEEDSSSVASSTMTSAQSTKPKMSFASAPIFKSMERAEKRKEYYSKLEEKQLALEAEKAQCEERTKEEREAELKQLRKSLTFKASPMPSFYHEGPPPKVERKKVPPTRAKSPKLGRRKSCSDTVNSNPAKVKGVQTRGDRHSLGSLKEDVTNIRDIPSENGLTSRNDNAVCKHKDDSKQQRVVINVCGDGDILVHS